MVRRWHTSRPLTGKSHCSKTILRYINYLIYLWSAMRSEYSLSPFQLGCLIYVHFKTSHWTTALSEILLASHQYPNIRSIRCEILQSHHCLSSRVILFIRTLHPLTGQLHYPKNIPHYINILIYLLSPMRTYKPTIVFRFKLSSFALYSLLHGCGIKPS